MKTLFEGKKLYAVIIVFLLIITFFITFHIIRNHYQYVLKNTINENKSTANLLSSLMYEHQKAAIGILESYSRRPLFIDAVKKKDFHRALYHLKSLSEHHSEMDAIFITDKSGTLWANYPVDSKGFGKNLAYRDWYKGVSKKWRPYISTVFRLIVLEKDIAVAVSVPVLDRKGKVIGILGSTQRTSFLAAFIKGNTIDPKKSIALLDQEGNIIFSNTIPYQENITKYPDARVLEKTGARVLTDMEIADAKEKGGISYVSVAPVRGIGWSVIVGEEKNAILNSLYGYFIRSAVTGFVIFLFLTVSLLYFRKEYRYRKTKELLQAEEKYRNIFENTVGGIYQTTPEGRFIVINPAFAAICGYASPEEMIEKVTDIPNQLYANPEDRLRLQKRIAAEEKVKGFEVQFKTQTRGLVWVSIHARALRDEQGNIRHYDGTIEDITERKQAEEALRRAEENFRRSLDESPLGVRIVTVEGETIYANRAMLNIYGYDSIEKLRTTHVKERYTPESYAEFQIRMEKRNRGDYTPSEYEVGIVRKDGEVRHLQVFRKEILWNGERQFQTIYQDITERKRAEEELRESEEKYRNILENIEDGYFEVDLAGNFTFFNPSLCRILGYPREEMPGMNNRVFMDAENAKKVFRAFNEVYVTGIPTKGFEWETIRKDGARTYIEVSVSLIARPGEKPTGFRGIARDVTERKRAEEELRTSEAQLSNALKIAHLGHWEYDVASDLFTFSDHFYAMLRATAGQVGGYTMSSAQYAQRFVHPDDMPVVGVEIRKALETTDPHYRSQLEHRIIYADGETGYITVRIFIVKDDQGRTIKTYGVNQDITEHKKAEEERERLLAEIAAKNQELESFVYTISHDLRAPLVSMDGFYSLLKRESQDQLGEQGQHYLERIRANVAHMNTLVTELLELSRIGRVVGPKEEIDVGVLLREIEKGLVLKLEQEGVEFIVQQPLPAVRGDRGRIRQVFANLIGNAVKFRSPERGLRIEVGCEEEERGFYRFHVRDNGIGILPQYQEQIFEPFLQLDKGIEGVGMGLAIVKRIVAYHRGRFWVESESGKGSTFYFTIPDRTNDDVRSTKYDRRLTKKRRKPMKGESK